MTKNTEIVLCESIVAQLDNYCQEHHVSRETAIESALHLLFGNEPSDVADMIAGYVAMGGVNTEICSAFAGCENEAYSHIH